MFYIWQAGEGGEGGRGGGGREGRREGGETTTMMTNKRLKPDLVSIQDRMLSKDISSEQIEVPALQYRYFCHGIITSWFKLVITLLPSLLFIANLIQIWSVSRYTITSTL